MYVPKPAARLWAATYLLMGMRYSDKLVSRLLEGVQNMRESTTCQAILSEGREEGREEGRLDGERRLLVRLGTKRFGEPDAAAVAVIKAIHEIDRLEALGERVIDPDVRDWQDLIRES